jgi:hypothetical protein
MTKEKYVAAPPFDIFRAGPGGLSSIEQSRFGPCCTLPAVSR